ncbi:MAG: formate dehydrogenase accessory protein FdhE [Chloroflexi bacterium]|nr:formate dehydrogenase accessory protein FdhE [Chloroflexota bacterium]
MLAVPRRAVEDLARALEHADEAAVGAARELPPAIKNAGAAAAGDPDGMPAQLEIVVRLDSERWPAVGATATVLQLLAMPMLQSARQTLEKNELANNARPWQAGYCPICAAWPALVEGCGLERQRMLRCGRCGSGWQLPWQLCPFCGNDDHRSLGHLFLEGAGEAEHVFTCDACQGYLKTLTAFAPSEGVLVPLEDLRTLDLDLLALEAGYSRPDEPGFRLNVALQWS